MLVCSRRPVSKMERKRKSEREVWVGSGITRPEPNLSLCFSSFATSAPFTIALRVLTERLNCVKAQFGLDLRIITSPLSQVRNIQENIKCLHALCFILSVKVWSLPLLLSFVPVNVIFLTTVRQLYISCTISLNVSCGAT